MQAQGILETALYCPDLEAAERFYTRVLGLRRIGKAPGRHVFFRCGEGVLLLFNPAHTRAVEGQVNGAKIPLHGAQGAGHVAFRAAPETMPNWRAHLQAEGVAIESEVDWPGGGHSIYFRDPAGNSLELATPEIWGE